jgi:hypothetical protein
LINIYNKVKELTKSKFWWANKEVEQVAMYVNKTSKFQFRAFQYPTKLGRKKLNESRYRKRKM